jgi:hypothetical protein
MRCCRAWTSGGTLDAPRSTHWDFHPGKRCYAAMTSMHDRGELDYHLCMHCPAELTY